MENKQKWPPLGPDHSWFSVIYSSSSFLSVDFLAFLMVSTPSCLQLSTDKASQPFSKSWPCGLSFLHQPGMCAHGLKPCKGQFDWPSSSLGTRLRVTGQLISWPSPFGSTTHHQVGYLWYGNSMATQWWGVWVRPLPWEEAVAGRFQSPSKARIRASGWVPEVWEVLISNISFSALRSLKKCVLNILTYNSQILIKPDISRLNNPYHCLSLSTKDGGKALIR